MRKKNLGRAISGHLLQRRIARSTVVAIAFTLFQAISLPANYLSPASAAIVTTGTCSVDGTNMSTSNIIDNTSSDGTCTIRFTSGTASFIAPTGINTIAALVVAGGGGGGFGGNGGGGGAGAVITTDIGVAVTAGSTISGTVGGGGTSGYVSSTESTWTKGGKGADSTLTISSASYVATGGGGGGAFGSRADDGGSGGGKAINGTGEGAGYNYNYASWSEYVNSGSTHSGVGGGGGGGAGGSPSNASSNGGIGLTIWGYSVGGGGSGWSGGSATVAAPYGGGAPRAGTAANGCNSCNGSANTGGGGGGGGAGGSGVVVLKYVPPRGQGTIAQTNGFQLYRKSTFTFTRTGTVPTNATTTLQWQVKPSGSSTWSNVTTGSGGATNTYQTANLTRADTGNSYRIAVTDSLSAFGISTTTYTDVSAQTLFISPGGDTDTALTTSGTKYATLSSSNPLIPGTVSTMTLQAWVKPTTTCDGAVACSIISVNNSYLVQVLNGKIRYYIGSGSAWCDGAAGKVPADAFVPGNRWSHITFVRVNSNVKIYINGQLRSDLNSSCSPATQAANSNAFFIGVKAENTEAFSGSIDEVRMWSTDRSANAASDMHSNETSTSGLLNYWNFNEGIGTVAYNDAAGALATTDLTVTDASAWDANVVSEAVVGSAYTTRTFYRSYITEYGGWKVPSTVSTASTLVIAGGGGGGSRVGGGGGAGGYAYIPKVVLTPNSIELIQVGQGGFGAQRPLVNEWRGQNGQNSLFGTKVRTVGGGGGAGYDKTANNVEHDGKSGGSGGGASAYSTSGGSGTPGTSTQVSTYGYGSGNSGGSGSGLGDYPAGGGGGAGGAGFSAANNSTAAAGGAGIVDPIGGTTLCYAAGGGGGIGLGASGAGGAAGSCGAGTTTTASAGTKGRVVPADATANSGSGGGGAGYQTGSDADVAGGSGGSGVIIIRWLTAVKPVFTQPTIDTTTAGIVDTITVSNDPVSPLTRGFKWQASSDTGTTWSDISTGSGFTTQTYSTPILETITSGARYQYRVIVTDSDTAGLFIQDTSTAVYIVINPRIQITGSPTTQKYGATHVDTFTAVSSTGTGNKTFSFSPNNRSGITWNGATANQATLTIAKTLGPGTYYETMTATDTRGASTQYGISIVVSKADTITVTSLARTDTYTGSALTFTPGYTITGLQNSDTVTSISWSYSGTENSSSSFGPSATKPVNAGSYQITPTVVILNSDSYTAVSYETSTLTINRATRTITGSVSPSPLKFGATGTLSATPSAGSDDGAITYTTSTTDSCTVSAANLQALKSSGTCSFTARIARGNNYESATSTSVNVSLAKADTLTVSVNAITSVTYTGNPAAVSPTVTVSGLQLTNAVGSNPVSISYVGQGNVGSTCAQGGPCAVGDTGPGGGIVFYVASTQQSWGRYLEAAPANWSGGADNQASNISKWCEASPSVDGTIFTGLYNGFGYGYINTYDSRLNVCTGGAIYKARTYRGGGYTNWYIPNNTELAIMADPAIRTMIGLVNDPSLWGYWGSLEFSDTGYIGSLVTPNWNLGATVKGETAKNMTRPIRAFSEGEIATLTYQTPPTDAGTYTVKATSLALSSGSLSNYQGVTYTDGSLLINRAQQSPLAIAQYGAFFGTPYNVMIFGGSGTGALTETVTAGTALGCTINGDTLTSTTVGTCQLYATKAQDRNYETATAVAYIYFLNYVVNQPSAAPSSGSTIALSGVTSVETSTSQPPSITGLSTLTLSLGAGGTFTITGTGFTGSISVKFWRNKVVAATSGDGTTINIPVSSIASSGATSGRISVITDAGQAVSIDSLTINP